MNTFLDSLPRVFIDDVRIINNLHAKPDNLVSTTITGADVRFLSNVTGHLPLLIIVNYRKARLFDMQPIIKINNSISIIYFNNLKIFHQILINFNRSYKNGVTY